MSCRVSLLAGILLTALCTVAIWSRSSGAPVPQDEYDFVPIAERTFRFLRSGELLLVTVDAQGDVARTETFPATSISLPRHELIVYLKPTRAYEYRSGRLILGTMMPDGRFVPDVGAKIIHFNDYRYAPSAIHIWNLPGYFKKKEPAGAAKDQKK